ETLERVDDGERCENREGTNQVVWFHATATAQRENFVDVGGAEIFASRAFRRLPQEIQILHKLIEQLRNELATNCAPRVSIKVRTMPCETCYERVDEHIAGTGIEGEHVRRLCVCGDDGEIRDAADVQRDATEFCVPPKKVVDIGHEWSALAAQCYIGGPEVAHSCDAGDCGDDR